MVRPFKNVHEQLNILHNRGLKLTDYQNNKLYLMTNNYYSIINGYSRYFWQTTNKYYPGTTSVSYTHLDVYKRQVNS